MTKNKFLILFVIVALILIAWFTHRRARAVRSAELLCRVRTQLMLASLGWAVVEKRERLADYAGLSTELDRLLLLSDLAERHMLPENVTVAKGEVCDAWHRPVALWRESSGDDHVYLLSAGANGVFEGGEGDDVRAAIPMETRIGP